MIVVDELILRKTKSDKLKQMLYNEIIGAVEYYNKNNVTSKLKKFEQYHQQIVVTHDIIKDRKRYSYVLSLYDKEQDKLVNIYVIEDKYVDEVIKVG